MKRMKWTDAVLDLLFPPRCPFCGKICEGVCSKCAPQVSYTAGKETLAEGSLPCAAPLWYEGVVREGILRFKFRGGSSAARTFGELVARCAAEEFGGRFDTVTWVPVSKKRLRGRGFDQARLLAEEACRHWDTKPEGLLRKITDNPAQSGIQGAAARRANVLGVFETVPGTDLRGKHVLLIDDIRTSGATLKECARVLEEAGAEGVVCVTLARAREQRK